MTAAFLAVAVFAALSVVPSVQAHEPAEELFEEATIVVAPYERTPSVVLDGVIGGLEYDPYGVWMDGAFGFTAYMLRDDDSLFVALKNPVPGWIALGFSADPTEGMAFVVVGFANGTFGVQQQSAPNVSDEMTFLPPEAPSTGVIEGANITESGGALTAEVQLSLNSSLWVIKPGTLVPTVLAFNETSASFPTDVAGIDVHFLRAYPLRVQDDPREISQLFASNISPIPALIAVGIMSVGTATIVASFVRREAT